MPLPLRCRGGSHRYATERGDGDRTPLGVAGFRQTTCFSGLRERDVAHVRDRGLDDACDADADEASLGACLLGADSANVVPRELEGVVEASCVIAGVVECATRRAIRKRVAWDEVAPS